MFATSGPQSLRVSTSIKQQGNVREYKKNVALLISKKSKPKCHSLLNSNVTRMVNVVKLLTAPAKYTLWIATDCTDFGKHLP